MAERAKQEVEQRVTAIKDKLTQERNEEIEVRDCGHLLPTHCMTAHDRTTIAAKRLTSNLPSKIAT